LIDGARPVADREEGRDTNIDPDGMRQLGEEDAPEDSMTDAPDPKEVPTRRPLPDTVDRTEVYPNLYVGGKASEWHFPGWVVDVREEDEIPNRGNRRIPVFQRLANGGWRADPVLAEQAVKKIADLLGQGLKVLVRCGSGIERSPAIVAFYLVRYQGLSVTEAYARIRAARPQVIEELDLLPLTYEERTR
jgi:hypothetical protein